jgi:hypothetical protein
MNTYFEIEDNIIDKKIQKYVDDQTFTSKKNVKSVIKRIVECYAENFCNGNQDKAIKFLMQENLEMRRKDSNLLSFFSGTLLITTIITVLALVLPTSEPLDSDLDW